MDAGWTGLKHAVNGLSLHVVEAGPPEGPLLVLLHGFPEFWWAWRHQITPLAQQGYHVVVPDMRGYNLSDAPQDVASYDLDVLVADVVALADRYGAGRFRLVGHDWGGIVAWATAARHPDRLGRLVVMDAPHPDLWSRQILKHPTQALRSSYVAYFQTPRIPELTLGAFGFAGLRTMIQAGARPDTFKPGELDRYVKAWEHPGSLTAMLNYYRALRDGKTRRPARIAPPTLVLWGENDPYLEHHIAHAALELCDDGQLSIIKGATHWLHLEEPEQIIAKLIRFLAAEEDAGREGPAAEPRAPD